MEIEIDVKPMRVIAGSDRVSSDLDQRTSRWEMAPFSPPKFV